MAVLSVDLAYSLWSNLGIVVLDRVHPPQSSNLVHPGSGLPFKPLFVQPNHFEPTECPIACEIIPAFAPGLNADFSPGPAGPVDANILAGRLSHLCGVRGIRVMMLDGPQAWKSRFNGLEHARVSERQLNKAAKTGLPGMVKPIPCLPFAEFCLDVYDALCRRGWRRLETRDQPGSPQDQNQERILVESYPFAAWRSLGLKPLPPKRRSKVSDLAEAYAALRSVVPITTNRPPQPRSASGHRGQSSPPRRGPLARGLHRLARAAGQPGQAGRTALAALTTCGGADAFGKAKRMGDLIYIRPSIHAISGTTIAKTQVCAGSSTQCGCIGRLPSLFSAWP